MEQRFSDFLPAPLSGGTRTYAGDFAAAHFIGDGSLLTNLPSGATIDQTTLVHTTGDETIGGTKSFTKPLLLSGSSESLALVTSQLTYAQGSLVGHIQFDPSYNPQAQVVGVSVTVNSRSFTVRNGGNQRVRLKDRGIYFLGEDLDDETQAASIIYNDATGLYELRYITLPLTSYGTAVSYRPIQNGDSVTVALSLLERLALDNQSKIATSGATVVLYSGTGQNQDGAMTQQATTAAFTGLTAIVNSNTTAIQNNTTAIQTNATAIQNNTTAIQSNTAAIQTNVVAISGLTATVATKQNTLTTQLQPSVSNGGQLNRNCLGNSVFVSYSDGWTVVLPDVTLADLGAILHVTTISNAPGLLTLRWNQPGGSSQYGTFQPSLKDLVTINTQEAAFFEVIRVSRGVPYNDTIAAWVCLSTDVSPSTQRNARAISSLPYVTTGTLQTISGAKSFTAPLSATTLQVSGNATAQYFIGDGSKLTNLPTGSGGGSAYQLSAATTSALGGIIVGAGLTVDSSGVLGVGFYSGTGQNTNGAMTQKATSDALAAKADLVNGKVPQAQIPYPVPSRQLRDQIISASSYNNGSFDASGQMTSTGLGGLSPGSLPGMKFPGSYQINGTTLYFVFEYMLSEADADGTKYTWVRTQRG